MVSSVVERATSSMLIAPDWALNMEICDMLNRDPVQVKDVVKSIKRRMGSKKPKVQLLDLTLLETIIKNCGDLVHMHVAQKGLPQEMVKIVKKKPDYQVKEKILSMLDTWQEAFGGPRARYRQYFAAYQDLLRGGTIFPQRSERGAPVITPPQSRPLPSYSRTTQHSKFQVATPGSSSSSSSSSVVADAHLPTMSLSEIQKVRGSVDVVSEMLSAIQPGNKEALRQEALVELLEQCRICKPKVVHLVNSTVDESLLCQGLALNDELQRVLAKYESTLVSQVSSAQLDKNNPKPDPEPFPQHQDRAVVDAPAESSSKHPNPLPQATPTPPDLLSCDLLGAGDDYSSPAQNSLALVPISYSDPQPTSPIATDQNALALVDLFSFTPNRNNPSNGAPAAFAPGSELQLPQNQNGTTPNMASIHEQSGFQQLPPGFPYAAQSAQLQPPSPLYQNGTSNSRMESPYEQPGYTQVPWDTQTAQTQQQQLLLQQQQHPLPSPLHHNGTTPAMGSTHDQSGYPPHVFGPSWGAHCLQLQHQPSSPVYGAHNGGAMPPPPWESQSTEIQPFETPFPSSMLISKMGGPQSPRMQTLGVPTPRNEHQIVGMFVQPITGSQLMALNQSFQMPNIYTQPMQGSGSQTHMMNMLSQALPSTTQVSVSPHQMYANQMIGYGQEPPYLEQGMYGLSLKDDASSNPTLVSVASYLPPLKQQPKAGGDLLFGDLVDIAKLKPAKATTPANGSM